MGGDTTAMDDTGVACASSLTGASPGGLSSVSLGDAMSFATGAVAWTATTSMAASATAGATGSLSALSSGSIAAADAIGVDARDGESNGVAGIGVGTLTRGAAGVAMDARHGAAASDDGVATPPAVAVANSARASAPAAMTMTPPHTEQRARTLEPGSLAGSTRNTDRHSGHVTFIEYLRHGWRSSAPICATHQPVGCLCGDPLNTRIPRVSSRSSSFPWRVRSPGLHA